MIFPPKLLSHQPILRGLFSLFLVCFSIYSLISEASSPSPKFLTRFTLTHLHRWSFTLTHSPIRPHPFIDSPSPSPILKGFWVWVKILQKRSSVGVGADCKVGFDQCIRVFVFAFLFSLYKKKRDSACVCVWVLIKELLLMFAEVMIFFWMGLLRRWFFLMGFFFLNGFEWVCSGDDFFDRWPGFQIGGVGFWSVAQVVGVMAVVGSNWFDGLCVCGSVDGLCLCVCGSVCVVMGLDRLIGVS